ncbi:MAG: choice-of-anchor V domain-containing protein [Bacteroidota bacterium]
MKRKLVVLSSLIVTVTLTFLSSLTTSYPTGAPSAVANDPASGSVNCTDCHSGTATPVTGWITSNIPSTGYVPGTTYTLTGTVTSSGKTIFGFEISPQNANGALVGSLTITNSTATKIVSTKYVTHTQAGSTGTNTRSWSFNWTAPANGVGAVTFYGSFLGGNNNGSTSGDITYTTSSTFQQASPCSVTANITTTADTLCPQDTATLTASGGVSYVWSTGATTSSIKVLGGTYTVTATAAAGCAASTTKTIVSKAAAAPTGLFSTNVFGASAKINWTKNSCATGYKIMYHVLNSATWKTATVADTNNKTIYALLPLTTYEYKMAGVYGTIISNYGSLKTFTTQCDCIKPTVTATVLSNSSVKFSWVDDACSKDHRIQYRKVGTTIYTTKVVYDSLGVANATITGLLPNTAYEYHVRTDCNSTGTFNSGYTTLTTFATPLRIGADENNSLSLYPNPSNGNITIDYTGEYTLKVYNLLGEVVFENFFQHTNANQSVDLSHLTNGMYLVSLVTADNVISTRLEIQK